MTTRKQQQLSLVLSMMFLGPACFKLFNVSIAVDHFTTWGIPLWFMHVIGVSEVGGAIGLLIPRTRLASAFALFLVMIGGLATHLIYGEYLLSLMPIAYGSGLFVLMKDGLPRLLTAPAPARAEV